MNGTLMHAPTTTFRVVPYFTQEHLDLPDLKQHLNISVSQLWKLENSTTTNLNDYGMLKSSNYGNSGNIAEDINKDKLNI